MTRPGVRWARRRTKEQIAAAREALGLDEPLVVQYARFAIGLIPFPNTFLIEDVYYSFANFVPVREEIFRRLQVSAVLGVGAATLWLSHTCAARSPRSSRCWGSTSPRSWRGW